MWGDPVTGVELVVAGLLAWALIVAFGVAWWVAERECTRLAAALVEVERRLCVEQADAAALRLKVHDQMIRDSLHRRALEPVCIDDMVTSVTGGGLSPADRDAIAEDMAAVRREDVCDG